MNSAGYAVLWHDHCPSYIQGRTETNFQEEDENYKFAN